MAIVLLGTLLRCWQASESLWLDELHTSWVVAEGPDEIAVRARAGNQSPLYFYIVWGVTRLLGHHEWTLRITSLVSGIMLIAASFELVRRWTMSAYCGLFVALLVALNRDCIFFAQEARPYALVQLSALINAAIFAAVLQRPGWLRRGLLVAGSAWLFHLHYTTFLFLIAEAVCLVILHALKRPRVAYSLSQAGCDAVLIALLLSPALTHVLTIAQQRDNWARIVSAWPPPLSLQIAVVFYALIPLSALTLCRFGRCQPAHFAIGDPQGIWAGCWFLVPPLIAFATTLAGLAALCMVRYLVASIVGAIVFAGLCQSAYHNGWYRGALSGLLVVATVVASGMVPQWSYDGRVIGDRNEAWDAAVPWLQSQVQREPMPVFLCAGLLEDLALQRQAEPPLQQYCLFPFAGIYRLQADYLTPLPTTTRVAFTAQQSQEIARQAGAWLVVRNRPQSVAKMVAALRQSLQRRDLTTIVALEKRFGNVTIVQLKCRE